MGRSVSRSQRVISSNRRGEPRPDHRSGHQRPTRCTRNGPAEGFARSASPDQLQGARRVPSKADCGTVTMWYAFARPRSSASPATAITPAEHRPPRGEHARAQGRPPRPRPHGPVPRGCSAIALATSERLVGRPERLGQAVEPGPKRTGTEPGRRQGDQAGREHTPRDDLGAARTARGQPVPARARECRRRRATRRRRASAGNGTNGSRARPRPGTSRRRRRRREGTRRCGPAR